MAAVFIYGFGPYMSFRDNVTEKTVRALTRMAGVQRRVFDVTFDRAMFERAFARVNPEIVIGLGQHPRARKLRLEQRCHPRGNPRTARFVSLRLPRTAQTTVTYDAGDYVCNFSMWVAGGWCGKNGARFAFIHVPRDYPPARLVGYLRRFLRKGRMGAAGRSFPRGQVRSR